MILTRFLRAIIGAVIGGVTAILYDWYYDGKEGMGSSITKAEYYIYYCAISGIIISCLIAFSRRYLLLEMKYLARILLGVFVLEVPQVILFFLLPYSNSTKLLISFITSLFFGLLIGGLAGLFYGNKNLIV